MAGGSARGAETEPIVAERPVDSLFQAAPRGRFYGGLEYLIWWVKPAPLSVPLVSTGPISTTHHGWLDSSDSTILYGAPFSPAQGGSDSQAFKATSGVRLTVGYWLDEEQSFAIEGSAFRLQTASAGYEISSDSDGNPIINIPVYNTIPYSPPGRQGGRPPNEDGLPASLPSDQARFDGNAGVFSGGVKIVNTLDFWGTDLTGVINLYRNAAWEVSGLAGFRYLSLTENFNLGYESTGQTGAYAGQTGVATDSFETRNDFYGGNFGLRGRYADGPLSVELAGTVALGLSHDEVDVNGYFASYNYIVKYASANQGIFAQPANEGRRSSDKFAVSPELQFKLGYALTPWLRATLGYDFIYYSDVVRPTDQIDRNLPKGQTFQQGGIATSSTSPSRKFQTTDFYAHGLSFGLEFSF